MTAATACAQDTQGSQESPQTTLSVTTRLVVLDVVVVDRNGKPVTNLDRSLFSITEDKLPQTIRNFDPPSGHTMPVSNDAVVHSVADLPKIGQAPVNVLVFDEVDTGFHQLAYARQMMEKYLKAQPAVLPVPTLFIAAGYSRVVVLHDYTQSRADLLGKLFRSTLRTSTFTQIVNTLNGGAGGSENGLVKTLGAMSQIAESVAGIPGRKNVIWVGTGYNKAYDLTNISEKDHDKVVTEIEQVTNKMLQARVTLYIIDPGGPLKTDDVTDQTLDPSNVTSAGSNIGDFGNFSDNMSMNTFADNTGGRVIGGATDLRECAGGDRSRRRGRSTTRWPTCRHGQSDAAQPFRKIHVTVNVPGLRVITREGYFTSVTPVSKVAVAPKAKQANDVKFDLMSAARTTMPYTALHTDAKRAKNGYSVLVNANDLKFAEQGDGSRTAEVTIVAVCYNNKGKETAQHAAEMKEALAASDVIKPESQVDFAFPMVVPPFTERVRFVVRDATTGALGSANANPLIESYPPPPTFCAKSFTNHDLGVDL